MPNALARRARGQVEVKPQSSDAQDLARPTSVAVIITSYNHAGFLADAIRSVLKQSRSADEIIVVDDGSTDDPAAIAAQFPPVRFVRQENRGLSAARNTGLRECSSRYVAFLDADDRLLPEALREGLACFQRRPGSAFVYGGHRIVWQDGRARTSGIHRPIPERPYLALLARDLVGMHATVLYRRDCILAVGGFDETLRRREDYDVYLRLARRYPVASHPAIIAEYRQHGSNMSADHEGMLRAGLIVLDRQKGLIAHDDDAALQALSRGRANCRRHYAQEMLRSVRARWRSERDIAGAIAGIARAASWSPGAVLALTLKKLAAGARGVAIRVLVRTLQRLRGRPGNPARISPVSRTFGFDRGTPVDRRYIEKFLATNGRYIRGRVLEIEDDTYTRRFGGDRVKRTDVLHVDAGSRLATIVGDLQDPECLTPECFDCIIFTQTLHLLFDVRAGIATLHRSLKPGGTLLMTVPGISQVDSSGEWGSSWYWSLTEHSVRRLLEEQFETDVEVSARGNVFAATAFLYGLAAEELSPGDMELSDPSYPVIIAARATKARMQ
jgi:SAM-dependent methyltransferase